MSKLLHRTTPIVRKRRKWLRARRLPITIRDRKLAQLGLPYPELTSDGDALEVRILESWIEEVVRRLDSIVRKKVKRDYEGTIVRYDWRKWRKRSWGGRYSSRFCKCYGDLESFGNGISLALNPDLMSETYWKEYKHIAHSSSIGDLFNLKPGEALACLCCHEVAHAVDGGNNHGARWQEVYRALRIAMGLVGPLHEPREEEEYWNNCGRPISDPELLKAVNYDEDLYRRIKRGQQQTKRRERVRNQAKRDRIQKCMQCGVRLIGRTSRAKFCSSSCRSRARRM